MLHIMLDLETLATKRNAVVLTCGAMRFDPYDITKEPAAPFYVRLNVDEQIEKGRLVDPDTVAWWGKQPQAAQDEAMSDGDRIALDDFTTQLNKYVVGADKIWAQGPLFDIVILEDIYFQLGKPVPWHYGQIRDSRTVFDMGDDSLKKNNSSAHNSLADAFFQAKAVQAIYQSCGVVKK